MKEILNKYKKSIIWFFVIGIIGIPLLIHIAFKVNPSIDFFVAVWDAGDVLSFYGSILGAVSTVLAIMVTIKFTLENQKEERKLSIRPYLQVQKQYYTNFDSLPIGTDVVYVDIRNGVIESQSGAFDEIYDIINPKEKKYNVEISNQAVYAANVSNYLKDRYLLYYEISNCGAGNAINVSLNINDSKNILNFCVTTTEPKKIMFVLNRELLNLNKKYKFRFSLTYSDVASLGKYSQEEELTFTSNSAGDLITTKMSNSYLTDPVELTEK